MSEELKTQLTSIRSRMSFQQVVVSRVIKTRGGDVFLSMTSNLSPDENGECTIKDARLAALLLGLEVSLSAHEQATANGLMSPDDLDNAVSHLKSNYTHLLQRKTK